MDSRFSSFATSFFQLIYEVAGPRYALHCFATHVEAKSPPVVIL